MVHAIVFAICLIAVVAYAAVRGGWPERVVAATMVAALLAGWLIPYDHATAYRQLEPARLATDVALFAAIYLVGLFADRYWPLWLAALQLLAVNVHGVRAYDPQLFRGAYHHLIEWISYVMIIVLVIGTRRHDRRDRKGRWQRRGRS